MRTSFASVLSVAILIAAIPASAQTNDPNLTDADLECLRRQAKGGPECVIGAAPAEPAANSATTAAISARPPPIRSPVMKYGSEAGILRKISVCQRLEP